MTQIKDWSTSNSINIDVQKRGRGGYLSTVFSRCKRAYFYESEFAFFVFVFLLFGFPAVFRFDFLLFFAFFVFFAFFAFLLFLFFAFCTRSVLLLKVSVCKFANFETQKMHQNPLRMLDLSRLRVYGRPAGRLREKITPPWRFGARARLFFLFLSRMRLVIFSKLVREKTQKNLPAVAIWGLGAAFLLIFKPHTLGDFLKMN